MTAWYAFWYRFYSLLFRLLFRLRVEGRAHVPPSGPLLVVSNHVSAVDPPIAGVAVGRQVWYMAKEELLKTPLLGPYLRSLGVFPVRRGEADRRSVRTALGVLQRGGALLMFPEGTRSPDGRLQPAEPGAALLALRTGALVLPLAVIGTQQVMPKGARFPRLRPVTVRIGPPIRASKVAGRLDRELLERWGQTFMAAIAALLPPDQQPVPGASAPRASAPEQAPEQAARPGAP
ncbi:MAG: lysophospholipid acyltransferase family protein [Armatimonadota bacterium]|nr:lysophospholipid acyltransferase family protein [Armatimonadota bacterium]